MKFETIQLTSFIVNIGNSRLKSWNVVELDHNKKQLLIPAYEDTTYTAFSLSIGAN